MKLLFFAIALFILTGCKVINPDEQEPSFLIIDSYSLNTQPSQGTSNESISELWVYANSDIQGVYDVPSQVPVLRDGVNTVTVFAGIKNNGMSSTRIRYPFYAGFDTIIDLKPLEFYHLSPHFEYYPNVIIDATRDFENSANFFQEGPNNAGNFDLISDQNVVLEGDWCGKASLSLSGNYMHFIDASNIVLQSGNTIFLEMNYSCNNTFVIGVYTVQGSNITKNPVIYLTPTTSDSGANPSWNKIYIDLGAVAGSFPDANYHQLFFESVTNESSTPTLFFDNLKIVNW